MAEPCRWTVVGLPVLVPAQGPPTGFVARGPVIRLVNLTRVSCPLCRKQSQEPSNTGQHQQSAQQAWAIRSWLLPRAHEDVTAIRAGCAKTSEGQKCWARHSHCCSDGGTRGYSVVPKHLCWRECHASWDGRVKRPALHSVDGDFVSRHAVLRIRYPIPADRYAGLEVRS